MQACRMPGTSLFVSPMPYEEDVPRLARMFDAVLVLVEEGELTYPLDLWGRHGVDLLHLPVEDFTEPLLLDLYKAVKWIYRHEQGGHQVLVHCCSGRGRSGSVTAAYLVYSKGLDPEHAVGEIRQVIPGAVETRGQEAVVKALDLLLAALPGETLDAVLKVGGKYDYGWGPAHVSKVTQLALKLWAQLRGELALAYRTLAPLVVASILHDIGRAVGGEGGHHEHTAKLVDEHREKLAAHLDPWTIRVAKWTAYHHRRKTGDPRKHGNTPSTIREVVTRLASILRVADALDYTLNQTVEDVEAGVNHQENKITITIHTRSYNPIVTRRAEEKSQLLQALTGGVVEVRVA